MNTTFRFELFDREDCSGIGTAEVSCERILATIFDEILAELDEYTALQIKVTNGDTSESYEISYGSGDLYNDPRYMPDCFTLSKYSTKLMKYITVKRFIGRYDTIEWFGHKYRFEV